MLKNYILSGPGEIDGYFDDFYHTRIPDLVTAEDARVQGSCRPLEQWRNIGTCPRCSQRTFITNSVSGVWHCEVCDLGGGVVAFLYYMNPGTYGQFSPPDGWELAARDVLAEALAFLDATTGSTPQ